MPTKIITKNSSTATAVPVDADLDAGELAVNTADGTLFVGKTTGVEPLIGSTVDVVGASAAFTGGLTSTGAGTDSFRAGTGAGATTQGNSSIALGQLAGETNQGDNGVIISGKGVAVDDDTAGHIHIASDEASLDYTNTDGWSATDAAGTFALRVDGWLAQFSAGRPILIAGTGQSNGNGWGIAAPYTSNSNVKDWATSGTTAAPTLQVPRAWLTPNTTTTVAKNDYIGLNNYIGYKSGRIGNINISMANYIANSTGRTVYVVQVNRDGADVRFWNPAGTGAYNAGIVLSQEVTAALASTEITTWNANNPADIITAPDILNIMQGESDAGGALGLTPPSSSRSVSPDVWADTWLGYIKNAASTYFKENHTRTIVYDVGQTYNWEEPRSVNMNLISGNLTPWRWNGCSALAQQGGNFFSFISSVGIEDQLWDEPTGTNPGTSTTAGQPFSGGGPIHFTGAGSNMQGELGAKTLLGEIGATATENNGWDILEGDQSASNLGMPYALRNQNRTTYENDGTTVARLAGKVEIDASTFEVTTVANGTWFPQPPVLGTRLVGSVTSDNDTWVEILLANPPNGLSDTGRYTGIATLESLITGGAAALTQQFSIAVYPFAGVIIAGTISGPFGTGGTVANPPELQVVAAVGAGGLSVQVRGVPASGDIKHRLTYDYNDISGI